jgi:hypothetical protein
MSHAGFRCARGDPKSPCGVSPPALDFTRRPGWPAPTGLELAAVGLEWWLRPPLSVGRLEGRCRLRRGVDLADQAGVHRCVARTALAGPGTWLTGDDVAGGVTLAGRARVDRLRVAQRRWRRRVPVMPSPARDVASRSPGDGALQPAAAPAWQPGHTTEFVPLDGRVPAATSDAGHVATGTTSALFADLTARQPSAGPGPLLARPATKPESAPAIAVPILVKSHAKPQPPPEPLT